MVSYYLNFFKTKATLLSVVKFVELYDNAKKFPSIFIFFYVEKKIDPIHDITGVKRLV
jgi:hypothetical protein